MVLSAYHGHWQLRLHYQNSTMDVKLDKITRIGYVCDEYGDIGDAFDAYIKQHGWLFGTADGFKFVKARTIDDNVGYGVY